MTTGNWHRNEDEQRRREAMLTLEQKLAWLDDIIETAVMLGYKSPPRQALRGTWNDIPHDPH